MGHLHSARMTTCPVFDSLKIDCYRSDFIAASNPLNPHCATDRQLAILKFIHAGLLTYALEAIDIHCKYDALWNTASAFCLTVQRMHDHHRFLSDVKAFARLQDPSAGAFHLARIAFEFKYTVLDALQFPKKLCPVRKAQPPPGERQRDMDKLHALVGRIWAVLAQFHCILYPEELFQK